MNRLILVGNGFDLAHNLPTSYKDFLYHYLKSCFEQATPEKPYRDELVQIICFDISRDNASDVVDKHDSLDDLLGYLDSQKYFPNPNKIFKVDARSNFHKYNLKFCSRFIYELFINLKNNNWVDIEQFYYKYLKQYLTVDAFRNAKFIEELNLALRILQKELKKHISTIHVRQLDDFYENSMIEPIDFENIPLVNKEEVKNYSNRPDKVSVLNFNYSSTIKEYLVHKYLIQDGVTQNHIHGYSYSSKESSAEIIFGFGDEIDDDYSKLENQNNNQLLEFIKSFGYFQNSNYHDLIRFIESDKYQVYIWGHSCGLSDRTMLNMIFEDPNCVSIKIFYYENDGKDNFTELTQNISRHFRDKSIMRKKIIPKDKSTWMRQLPKN